MYKSTRLILDTDELQYSADGEMTWDLSAVRSTRSLQIPDDLREIIGFRLAPVRMLYNSTRDHRNPDLLVGVLLKEYASDSILNAGVHFIFTGAYRDYDGSYTDSLNNVYFESEITGFNKGFYWFNNGISPNKNLTIQFSNLLSTFKVPQQITRWRVTSVFTTTAVLTIDQDVVPGFILTSGTSVVISGYVSLTTTTTTTFSGTTITISGFLGTGAVGKTVFLKTTYNRYVFQLDVFYL